MKFKISTLKDPKHKNGVICVSWNNTEDVLSCGDDHKLLKWNLASGECNLVTTFADDFYPTGMHLFPKLGIASGGNKQQNEVLLITTADGKFHIVNQNGRIDKSVVGHQGACLAGQWSPDGAGFLTAGEDGLVKLWSRNGLLRSCIVQLDIACYCAVWGPDSMSVLHSKGNFLVIKQLSSNLKTMKWKAHDSLVLCVSWNANNNLVISGSEDGYFKVWDPFGQQLFSSIKHEDPITSSTWAPAGDLFVIGSYNLLRLCNSSGWSHCLDRPTSGGIRNIAWSSDGTQLAAACANGHVLFAHIIDRQLNWKHYTCNLIGRKAIMMKDITSDTSDQLDYPDRVIQLALEHNHLVVATVKQCYVHSLSSWNTPVVFDLKDGTISMVLLSERCLCIVERATVTVYSYLGRLLANPKWVNMRPELLGKSSITLGPDTLAVIDQVDKKAIHIFELPTGLVVRSSTDYTSMKIMHRLTVCSVALSQTGPTNERQLAILDYNKDLYITTVKDNKAKFRKLGTQILGIAWSAECELLAGLRANSIVSWCCPRTANLPDWQTLTTVHKDINDMGRNPCLLAVEDGIAHIYLSNGSLLHVAIVPFPEKLLKHIASNQWQNALKLCRTVEDETLWACLAVLSWHNRELDVAEEAFAMIKHYHQVEYIQQLKSPEKNIY